MSFSQNLRTEADEIFNAIFEHPFVRGIAKGDLKKEQLTHYVKQDFEYLNVFMRIYGIAVSKCQDREDIQMFSDQMSFILNSEIHPHNNFCQVAGVSYDELQGYSLAPAAHHYTRHMLTAAHEGTLGDILAALLPCPLTYLEIGKELIQEVQPDQTHPFYDWIMFYGSRADTAANKFCNRLDQWAQSATDSEKEKMKDHFLLSCQLEYLFWDMAYKLEDWPVKKQVMSP